MAIPTLELKTYRYRGSSLHVFSTLWIGVLFGMVWLTLSNTSNTGQRVSLLSIIIGVIAVTAFAAAGAWVQAACWLEKINLGPDGIEWYGWNGQLKTRAQLGEIKSIDVERRGKLDVMEVETMHGTIKATSHLRGFKELAKQVHEVIEGFNEGLRPIPRKG